VAKGNVEESTMINMQDLEKRFANAKQAGARFIAIVVEMKGFPYDEIIANPIGNADKKLEYYKKVYNDDLTHKFSEGIRIVGCTYGNNLNDIEWDFLL
jgi:hypothetical protein